MEQSIKAGGSNGVMEDPEAFKNELQNVLRSSNSFSPVVVPHKYGVNMSTGIDIFRWQVTTILAAFASNPIYFEKLKETGLQLLKGKQIKDLASFLEERMADDAVTLVQALNKKLAPRTTTNDSKDKTKM